jgi:nucleoside-diphosphate-sugar epimerase
MRVLFIGGTGNLSLACTARAQELGMKLVHANRGNTPPPAGVQSVQVDIRNADAVQAAFGDEEFDAVVDFIAFTPEHVEQDIRIFGGRTAHYLFISSASAYQKPVVHLPVTESTPLANPFWEYARNKQAAEERLFHEWWTNGFPVTVVRPSHTYSDGWFPTSFGHDFTVPQRMLDGKPIAVHGDGSSLWTITHVADFAVGLVGLLGHPGAIGRAVHITGQEAPSWDQIHRSIGMALGVEPQIVHATSEQIAAVDPEFGAGLLGDKRYSMLFDNSLIRSLVPGYRQTISFAEGMHRSAAAANSNPALRSVRPEINALIERVLEAVGA